MQCCLRHRRRHLFVVIAFVFILQLLQKTEYNTENGKSVTAQP